MDAQNFVKIQKPTDKSSGGGLIAAVVALLCVILSLNIFAVSIAFSSARKGRDTSGLNYAAVFSKVRPSCVELYGLGSSASGVVYKIADGKTYVITNHHALGGSSTLDVRFIDYGNRIASQVLGYDEYHDIALLEVDGKYGTPVKRASAPNVGDPVLAVGNNLGYGIAAFDGMVSKTNRIISIKKEGKAVPVYTVTSPLNAGTSGGGLFDKTGKILGINAYQTTKVSEKVGDDDEENRFVDGVSHVIPYAIAEKIAEQIYHEKSRTQINKLVVQGVQEGGYALPNQIEFASLYFTAQMTESGFKVVSTLEDNLSECIGGKVQTGDTVVRIGSLKIGYGTDFCDIFTECFKYISDTDLPEKLLEVEVKRGNETVKVKYGTKRLKNY